MSLKDSLGIWSDGRRPLYLQLADALIAAIDRGDLAPRTRLPSERELAGMLAVSRTTVIAAFDLLRDQGLVERRQGSGTWIARRSRRLDVHIPEQPTPTSYGLNRVVRASTQPVPDLIDLSSAGYTDVEPIARLLSAIDPTEMVAELDVGYLPAGHPSLRKAVADYLCSLDVPTTPSQVLITTGIQQAADLILALYAPDGGVVITENPTWSGVLDVIRARGAQIVGVPVDEFGVCTGLLLKRVQERLPRLAWLTSGYHNPTGVRLGEQRAQHAARLAGEFGFLVVEDLALRDITLGEPPAPPIAKFNPHGSVMTVGTFSKSFWPGLRLGWVRASEHVVVRLARQKAVRDGGTPQLDQVFGAHLLRHRATVAAERSARARETLAAITGFVEAELPGWTYEVPQGGLSLWVQLPKGVAYELAQVAQRHLVEFVPGESFSPDGSAPQHLRLPLAHSNSDTMRGMARLAEAWRAYAHGGRV